MTRFLVIPNFWGPVVNPWPWIILLRMVMILMRASVIPVRNSGTFITTVSLYLYLGWVLILTFREFDLSVRVLPRVGSDL